MVSIILCAGYGTRLYPLTKEAPKALLSVRGKPILEYVCEKVQLLDGVSEILIVVNARFFNQFKDWLDNYPSSVPIRLINDGSKNHKDRLGAVRDLAFVCNKENITDDILVIGGDNLFDFELSDFIKHSLDISPNPVIGVYNLDGKSKAKKYGVVQTDIEGRVIDFYEKPSKLNGSRLISLCLYYLPKETLPLIDKYINYTRHPSAQRSEASPQGTPNTLCDTHDPVNPDLPLGNGASAIPACRQAGATHDPVKLRNGAGAQRTTDSNRYPLNPKSNSKLTANRHTLNANLDSIGNYIKWLAKNSNVYGYTFNGSWFDIGDIDSYTEAVCSF